MKKMEELKRLDPDQVILIETPEGSVQCKLGDALIYDDPRGWIVIDSE